MANPINRLHIEIGDITSYEVDAIVNAANRSLLGGGGVDAAIHVVGGPELLEACKGLNGCKTGHSKITLGYRLPAKYVIHTVGPVWQGGQFNENELLASCYKSSFNLAADYGLKSIAFPAISTGAYNFPAREAARIALVESKNILNLNQQFEHVFLVCFSTGAYGAYLEAAAEVWPDLNLDSRIL